MSDLCNTGVTGGLLQSGDKWITIPNQTKDKIIALERISQKLGLGLKITVID